MSIDIVIEEISKSIESTKLAIHKKAEIINGDISKTGYSVLSEALEIAENYVELIEESKSNGNIDKDKFNGLEGKYYDYLVRYLSLDEKVKNNLLFSSVIHRYFEGIDTLLSELHAESGLLKPEKERLRILIVDPIKNSDAYDNLVPNTTFGDELIKHYQELFKQQRIINFEICLIKGDDEKTIQEVENYFQKHRPFLTIANTKSKENIDKVYETYGLDLAKKVYDIYSEDRSSHKGEDVMCITTSFIKDKGESDNVKNKIGSTFKIGPGYHIKKFSDAPSTMGLYFMPKFRKGYDYAEKRKQIQIIRPKERELTLGVLNLLGDPFLKEGLPDIGIFKISYFVQNK